MSGFVLPGRRLILACRSFGDDVAGGPRFRRVDIYQDLKPASAILRSVGLKYSAVKKTAEQDLTIAATDLAA
jgi:hypothetical protein